MSEPKLWGVKRPDGTMFQIKPSKSKLLAVIRAGEDDFMFRLCCDGANSRKVRRAQKAGYRIVLAAVVEVTEEA